MGRGKILKIAHISANKVEAAEDAVTFAPQLFRLQKSVILSEPSEALFSLSGGHSLGGERTQARTLQEWYKDADALAARRESLLLKFEKERDEELKARREAQGYELDPLGEQDLKSGQAEMVRQSELTKLDQEQKLLLRRKPGSGASTLGGQPAPGLS